MGGGFYFNGRYIKSVYLITDEFLEVQEEYMICGKMIGLEGGQLKLVLKDYSNLY
jgi:ATP-dependent RNA circularization protein (DNA/RNA ligase family)